MTAPTDRPNLVAIGGSAGALAPLGQILSDLAPDLSASVLVCLHRHQDSQAFLPELLQPKSPIPVHHPEDGAALATGRILVAPPDRHMILQDGRISLTRGPRENMSRPAIDVTFRSAALEGGPRTIGVLLSGMLDDGAAGMRAIERCGGHVIVQSDADYPEMPRAAEAALVRPELLPAAEIAARLADLLQDAAGGSVEPPKDLLLERQIALGRALSISIEDWLGLRSDVTCPECSGGLWEMRDQPPVRFRCHTGHAYSIESLAAAQVQRIEESLWTAMRAFRERGQVLRRLAELARNPEQRKLWEDRAEEVDNSADQIAEGLITLGGKAALP